MTIVRRLPAIFPRPVHPTSITGDLSEDTRGTELDGSSSIRSVQYGSRLHGSMALQSSMFPYKGNARKDRTLVSYEDTTRFRRESKFQYQLEGNSFTFLKLSTKKKNGE